MKINVQMCCNNMIASLKTKDVIINEGEFCLGNSSYELKQKTPEFDRAIVLINFCPWCGKLLKPITEEIKKQIQLNTAVADKVKENILNSSKEKKHEDSNELGK